MQQLILAPGEGLSVENQLGGLFTFKITSDESDGALRAIETFVVDQIWRRTLWTLVEQGTVIQVVMRVR
jgi:hypothetical protein